MTPKRRPAMRANKKDGQSTKPTQGPEGYKIEPGQYYKTHLLINAYLADARRGEFGLHVPDNAPGLKTIVDGNSVPWGFVLVSCLKRIAWIKANHKRTPFLGPLSDLVGLLAKKKFVMTSPLLQELFEIVPHEEEEDDFDFVLAEVDMVGFAERTAAQRPLSPECCKAIRSYRDRLGQLASNSQRRGFVARLSSVIGERPSTPIEPNEAWSDAALDQLEKMKAKERKAWEALLQRASIHNPHKPSDDWLQQAMPCLQTVGEAKFKSYLHQWAALVGKPGTRQARLGVSDQMDNTLISDFNADVLRGLIWCCPLTGDSSLSRMLSDLAAVCFEKLPGRGQRSPKVGNACVYALGELPGVEPVAQLARLRLRVKNRLTEQLIDKALTAAAQHRGLSKEELEEIVVPAYGLTEVGVRRETLGDYMVELAASGSRSTELRWLRADGQPQKSIPSKVQKQFAKELKELKASAKDLQKMLPVQRERLDSLYRRRKSWPLETWRERYLDHPLVGTLARRLIWTSAKGKETREIIFCKGELVDIDDRPIDFMTDDTTVSLWHPMEQGAEAVVAWRSWLENHQVVQPFKQAHREVYVLTDAERQTQVYSNRFAAHILKQYQFNALAMARGWKYKPLAGWDEVESTATVDLPAWNLRAEFWVSLAGEVGEDQTDASVYLYVATDQVRFYAGTANGNSERSGEPLALADVPPLIFSEVMRDVDLFVGVASVGNDPTWQEGRTERYRPYWYDYSFGELGASAETRKAVLERLIPRLKIAERCSLADRFLIVRGDLRTYKIHLGSGNILMAPNDQYLCIVPGRGTPARGQTDNLFLPFEGDQTLSVILSKAFLLAEDRKITDPTIANQIWKEP
jgi:hypothetical protein